MHIGHYISGAGHVALIGWLLFGQAFRSDPPPLEVTEVAVLSEAEFAALTQRAQPPESTQDIQAPVAPAVNEDAPVPPPSNPAPEPTPDPVPEPEPVPEPPAPEPVPQVQAPDVSPRPVPRPETRVAPEPVEQSDPALPTDVESRPDTTPDAEAEVVEPEQDAAAPEAAATEIVTEAEEPASAAPVTSLRPRLRPQNLQTDPTPPQTAEVQDPAPDLSDQQAEAVNAALASILSGGTTNPEPDVPVGDPLTAGEQNALRVAVEKCWVVDVGSQAANVTVTIAMQMDRDGRVVTNSLELISSEGGDGSAVDAAYRAARSAVYRCQGDGYELPIDKYEQWKAIEMTFNPEKMRLR